MPHNKEIEEIVDYFFKFQSVNHYPEDKNKLIKELKPIISVIISDLKKSIREEIEIEKLKNLLEARDNGFNEEEEMFAFNQALDEILSLKSLE